MIVVISRYNFAQFAYLQIAFHLLCRSACQNSLFYILLPIPYFWNCIYSQLARWRFFVASNNEPLINVPGEAEPHYTMLARYRLPRKKYQKIIENSLFWHPGIDKLIKCIQYIFPTKILFICHIICVMRK